MLAKILVFSVALAVTSCQDYYRKAQYEPQEYQRYAEHVPVSSYHQQPAPIYEASSSEVQAPSHVQETSHNVVHYTHGQQGSEDSQEHYRPVYHYVQAEPESQSQSYASPVDQQTHIAHGHSQLSHEEYSHQHPAHEPAYHYAHNDQTHDASHHQLEDHSREPHDKPIDYYAYPKYQYEYKVEDPHTGDNKYQHEVRDGDVVKGVYSLHEADGSIRTVEYSSDKHNGFTAVVKHSAPGQHVEYRSHQKH